MKPITFLDSDTFLIDNSHYENYILCPRKAQYAVVEKRTPDAERAALTFGGHLHLALKLRYLTCFDKAATEEVEARQMVLLERLWEARPTVMGDHRTLGLAQRAISKYNKAYKDEPFSLLTDPSGRRIVEEPFAMPLGVIHPKGFKLKIVWTGVIDLPVSYGSEVFTFDHKSSSIGGDYFFNDFMLSDQMMGYCWVLKNRFNTKVSGAEINALFIKKPGKTERAKDPISFARQKIYYDDEQIEEWRTNTLKVLTRFFEDYEDQYFPMHRTQCIRKYGACPYFNVCTMAPNVRDTYLQTTDFKDDTWDPLHAEFKHILDEVLALPKNKLSYTIPSETFRAPTVNTEDYLDLLNQ